MNSEKFVEHVRSSHFYLVSICFVILICSYLLSHTQGGATDALRELQLIEELLDIWNFEDATEQFVQDYEKSTGSEIPRHWFGKIVFGDDPQSLYISEHLLPEHSDGPGYMEEVDSGEQADVDSPFPLTEEFRLESATLVTNSLIEMWEMLELGTPTYPVPQRPAHEYIFQSGYNRTPHAKLVMERPNSLSELRDFWSILNLNFELVMASPPPSSMAQGIFEIRQHDQGALGTVQLQVLNESDTCWADECFWGITGGIQAGSLLPDWSFESDSSITQEAASTIEGFAGHYQEYRKQTVAHLSIEKIAQYGATVTAGWIEQLNGGGLGAKDDTVYVSIIVPVEHRSVIIDPQGWLIGQLPYGFPIDQNFRYGVAHESFPNIYKLQDNIGNMHFADIENYLVERASLEASNRSVTILGVNAPIKLITVFGGLIIIFFTLYFFLQFSNLILRLTNPDDDKKAWNVPWIGMFTPIFSRLLLFTSTVVLPWVCIVYLQRMSIWTLPSTMVIGAATVLAICLSRQCIAMWRISLTGARLKN